MVYCLDFYRKLICKDDISPFSLFIICSVVADESHLRSMKFVFHDEKNSFPSACRHSLKGYKSLITTTKMSVPTVQD